MADTAESSSALRAQVEATQAQLAAYARDFRTLLDAEREKTKQLAAANLQLQSYAHDLRHAFDAEQSKTRELERAYLDTVERLIAAARCKDDETGNHILRLRHYARVLARALGWQKEAIEALYHATPMHDIGKLAVPDAILQKPGPLDASEWVLMRRHPEEGAALLHGSASPVLELGRRIALSHHERWDGTGYPHGLRGERIPLAARLVMLVDQYDALRSRRPYKPALTHERTCRVILQGDGRTLPGHFDPRLLAAFRLVQAEFAAIHKKFAD